MTLITLADYQKKAEDSYAGRTGIACPTCNCELTLIPGDKMVPDEKGRPGKNATCSSDTCGFKTVITL